MTESYSLLYRHHRYPSENIRGGVVVVPISAELRMAEYMLDNRGIFVTHKTVHEWAKKFGRAYASNIRHHIMRLGDEWR